jgi:hypothetical protein
LYDEKTGKERLSFLRSVTKKMLKRLGIFGKKETSIQFVLSPLFIEGISFLKEMKLQKQISFREKSLNSNKVNFVRLLITLYGYSYLWNFCQKIGKFNLLVFLYIYFNTA